VKRSLVFVVFLGLCSSVLAADKQEWNGYWWASMTPSFKLGWVSGYAKAMDFAGVSAIAKCAGNMSIYKDRFPNIPPKDLFQNMCGDSNKDFDYDGISIGQFVDGMDTFYKDYRKKQLEVGWAIQYVRDEIRGKSSQELDAEITLWRRCSAAYQTGDTEQITKACTPNDPTAPKK
jgi:hypothetical protein